MSQTQIRLTRTPDINKVLSYLQDKYQLLSEADIIKLALSEKYNREKIGKEEALEKEQQVQDAYAHLMREGKKIGDKLLAKKGLKRKDITEARFYNLFLNTHKHNA